MQLQTLLSFKPSGWVPFSWSTVFFSSCLGQRSEHAVSGLRCEGVWLIRYFGGWRPRSALQQGFVPSSRLCVSYARHLWLVRQAGPHRPPLFLVKLLATVFFQWKWVTQVQFSTSSGNLSSTSKRLMQLLCLFPAFFYCMSPTDTSRFNLSHPIASSGCKHYSECLHFLAQKMQKRLFLSLMVKILTWRNKQSWGVFIHLPSLSSLCMLFW